MLNSSSSFYLNLHLLMNCSLRKLQRRVACVWTFFSPRLIKLQKDFWQIQNWLQPRPLRTLPIIDLRKQSSQTGKVEMIWTQKVFDLDTKSIWFGHKIYLSNREIRSTLNWCLIFWKSICFTEFVIRKQLYGDAWLCTFIGDLHCQTEIWIFSKMKNN